MFMVPIITNEEGWLAIEKEGETNVLPEEDVSLDMVLPENPDDVVEITRIVGYGARMSAPGYMDCTDWVVYSSRENAAKGLLELHFDGPLDEMDEEELEAVGDLAVLAGNHYLLGELKRLN